MTTVGFAGRGPAVSAAQAALEDVDAGSRVVDAEAVGSVDAAVAVGPVGGGAVRPVATAAREAGTPLFVVELGGVGGLPVEGVDAAVAGVTGETACHDCLRARVAAADPETDEGRYDAATARFAGATAGRELVGLLSGGRSSVMGGVVEIPHARRRVLPVPYCACGSADRETAVPRDAGDRTVEEALAAAEVAFDARVGPVPEVGEVESFPVPYYLATLAATPFSDARPPEHAAGVAVGWDEAFMKALGEALERYSAGVYRTDRLRRSPANPLDPARFVHPGEAPDAGSVDAWHPAEHLESGAAVEVPAELVVFPPPERRIRPAITTGLGLGDGGVGALLSGLYEVIERDAAMLAWYSTYEPLGLSVDDEGFGALRNRLRSEGLSVTALSLTQDVDIPVVAACVHREGEWPRFAAGMAADLDPGAAARGALEEATQNWLELRRMGPEAAAEESGAIGRYADFPAAAREFVDPATTVPASSVGPANPPSGRAELAALVDRVAAAGLDAYAARLTPRDVDSLGFEAVRVVVPPAQPLFTDDAYFGERARTVPDELGFRPRLDRDHHPYP